MHEDIIQKKQTRSNRTLYGSGRLKQLKGCRKAVRRSALRERADRGPRTETVGCYEITRGS